VSKDLKHHSSRPRTTTDPHGEERPLRVVTGGQTYESLVHGLVRREEAAARQVYGLFGERINHLVFRLLGVDAEHDDVVNQVFQNILSSISQLKQPQALEAWIVRVAVNTVRNEIRRRKRRRLFVLLESQPESADQPADPNAQLFVRSCYRILDSMSTTDRLVFVLQIVEGYTLPEIADACGCSLATVKRRLARAKARFKKRASRDFVLSDLIGEPR